jgi:hypothetical protein
MNATKLDAFTAAYVECALWSSTDDDGNPLDDNYGIWDIDRDTIQKMIRDCARFQDENAADIATFEHISMTPEESAGMDFWLTRNGHGAGFWDGDWGDDVGERLTENAKAYREYHLYVGDDGKLYGNQCI